MTQRQLRSELTLVLEALIAQSAQTGEVSLDALGEAIGARAISQDEIDALLDALEAQGRRVVVREGGHGERHLHAVLKASRALKGKLGRTPTTPEIAEHSGLSIVDVRHALALARIMQR